MRISSATALALALTACGQPPATQNAVVAAEATQAAAAAEEGRVLCARGDEALTRDCTVEQTQGEGGLVLTLRHPDGGFHRLRVTRDGRGVVAADGAEAAIVAIAGPGEIDVRVGADRYRLPATVKPGT